MEQYKKYRVKKTKVRAEVLRVTPELAQEWMDRTGDNNYRRVYQSVYRWYGSQMLIKKRWKLNGESIKLSPGLKVLDGQHRLLGCIWSKVAFETLVLFNVDPSSAIAMDRGRGRSLGMELDRMKIPNYSTVASVLKLLWKYENGGYIGHGGRAYKACDEELLEFFEKHLELPDMAKHGRKLKGILSPSHGTFLYYQFKRRKVADAEEFHRGLIKGSGLDEGDPRLALRNKLLRLNSQKGMRPKERDVLAWSIKAWNAWREGVSMNKIQWVSYGPDKEEFPVIS